jgi:hypothetical protein
VEPKRLDSSSERPSISEIRKRIAEHSQAKSGAGPSADPSAVMGRRDRLGPDRAFDFGHDGKQSGDGAGNRSMRITDLGRERTDRAGPVGGDAHGATHGPRFTERQQSGDLGRLTRGEVARKIKLDEQFRMMRKGDVARRLDLHDRGPHGGDSHGRAEINLFGPHFSGWRVHHQYHGWIDPGYVHGCFRFHYWGPWYYPSYCWYPTWSPWVSWSWYYHCDPFWDPRPLWCRPVVYVAAPRWVYYQVPVWVPLPEATCGTWVDVEPVVVGPEYDLQLLAVRFVDPGHPEEQLGPRYRVWIRNNSDRAITRPFDVFLLASADQKISRDVLQAGVRVGSIGAGEVQAVDVRLPVEVASMGVGEQGEPAPFTTLSALVDANREVSETSESNNGARIAREEILPVDPAAFELDPTTAAAGGEVVLAGEGFGPEPGQVLLHLGGIEMEAEILGWYDLGVRLRVPALPLAAATEAELIVVRGDGAAANPLPLTITPATRDAGALPALPALPQ